MKLFLQLLAFTTQKIATHCTDIISAVGVAFFSVVNANRRETICLQFLIPTAVCYMLLTTLCTENKCSMVEKGQWQSWRRRTDNLRNIRTLNNNEHLFKWLKIEWVHMSIESMCKTMECKRDGKTMWNTMECKRDSFSGAVGGARETHWDRVSHALKEFHIMDGYNWFFNGITNNLFGKLSFCFENNCRQD